MSIDPMGSSYPLANSSIHEVAPADISAGTDNERILPRQLSSGSTRGTQTVGYGDVKIDGSNNQITIGSVTNTIGEKAETIIGKLSSDANDESFGLKVIDASGTSVVYGLLSDGTPGMEITDSSGFVLFKLTGKTWYWFDKTNNTNTMQAGLLPSGDYGWVAVPPTNSVAQVFGD